MIDINAILIDFFDKTWMAWAGGLVILAGMAKETKFKWDEKIVRVLVSGITTFIPNFQSLIFKDDPAPKNTLRLPKAKK